MPLLRQPSTEELEDHFFGSGAFQFGWLDTTDDEFPATVREYEEDGYTIISETEITEQDFVDGIKKYAETLEDRTFNDLIEDMDAVDVDNVIQLIIFGEIKYS